MARSLVGCQHEGMSDAVFKALADPTRREILKLLKSRAASVGEIKSHFDMTQQAISQHLRVLKQAELLESSRQGTKHLYRTRRSGMAPAAEFLQYFVSGGLQRMKLAVQQEAARGRNASVQSASGGQASGGEPSGV